jgi:hypothetical protein
MEAKSLGPLYVALQVLLCPGSAKIGFIRIKMFKKSNKINGYIYE